MRDDQPSRQILADWAYVSARSQPRPIIRRGAVLARRPIGVGVRLVAMIVIVAVGLFAVDSQRHDTASTALPSAPHPSAIATPTATLATPSSETATARPVDDFQAGRLVTAADGWALSGADLLVTHDDGRSWTVTTPPAPSTERIVGAAFADGLHGWVVSDRVRAEGSSGMLGIDVHRTDDGGATWQTVTLASIPSPGPDPLVGFPTFSVVSSDVAYILIQAEGAPDFDFRLFATIDGGRTWQSRSSLPLRSITFVDRLVGWAVRNDSGALVRTADGGKSWASQQLPAVPGVRASDLSPGSGQVRLADGSLLLFEPAARDGDRGAFFTSHDDGSTWALAARGPTEAGSSFAVLDRDTWILGGGPSLLISHDAGTTWRQAGAELPGPIALIVVGEATHVSAIVAISNCAPSADCAVPLELWISDDAGTTWRDVTP